MSGKVFIDTNLWVYLYADETDKEKTQKIKSLVNKYWVTGAATS